MQKKFRKLDNYLTRCNLGIQIKQNINVWDYTSINPQFNHCTSRNTQFDKKLVILFGKGYRWNKRIEPYAQALPYFNRWIYVFMKSKEKLQKITKWIKPTPKNVNLEKSTKIFSFLNQFLLKISLLNVIILTYFYFWADITFHATGWLALPQNIKWYYVFLGFIFLRMSLLFFTQEFSEYIKNVSLWNEKKKKTFLNALTVINLLTIPFNFPLIGSLFFYLKGNEIICKNLFLGTFQRPLNENEKNTFYQDTVQNFLEKVEASQEIKDQLKNWAFENTKSFLEKYKGGSASGTESVLKVLVDQKEFLQLEEILAAAKNVAQTQTIQIKTVVNKPSQNNSTGIYDQINSLKEINIENSRYQILPENLTSSFIKNELILNRIKMAKRIKQEDLHVKSVQEMKKSFKAYDARIDLNKTNQEIATKRLFGELKHHEQTVLKITSIHNDRIRHAEGDIKDFHFWFKEIKDHIENTANTTDVVHGTQTLVKEAVRNL